MMPLNYLTYMLSAFLIMPVVEQPPHPGGVMAAPNNARLIIRILTIAQSTEERRKWLIKFEIIDAESIAGPLFARPKQIAEGFTFESCENLSKGDKVTAEAEYIGDAHRGLYQMKKLVAVE